MRGSLFLGRVWVRPYRLMPWRGVDGRVLDEADATGAAPPDAHASSSACWRCAAYRLFVWSWLVACGTLPAIPRCGSLFIAGPALALRASVGPRRRAFTWHAGWWSEEATSSPIHSSRIAVQYVWMLRAALPDWEQGGWWQAHDLNDHPEGETLERASLASRSDPAAGWRPCCRCCTHRFADHGAPPTMAPHGPRGSTLRVALVAARGDPRARRSAAVAVPPPP